MASEHYHFSAGLNLAPDEPDLTVLFSGEGKPVPGHKMGPSVHDYYLIHTVIDGKGIFQSGSNSQVCGTGDTFVIFPGVLFSYQADMEQPWTYVWVALQGEAVQQLFKEVGITPDKPLIHIDNLIEIHNLYEHIRFSFQQSAYPRLESLEASGWLRLLVHKFGLANKSSLTLNPHNYRMLSTARSIKRSAGSLQFHQQISIDHMASSLGYHRAHLSKAFKQRSECHPSNIC